MVTRSPREEHTPVTVAVPFAASSVGLTRRWLKSWMSEQELPREVVDDARLVISELVGNSVRHARPLSDGTIQVSWRRDRRGVRISVTDGGSSSSRPRTVNASASAVSWRGLAIVDALATDWWAEQGSSRSTIHALLATS